MFEKLGNGESKAVKGQILRVHTLVATSKIQIDLLLRFIMIEIELTGSTNYGPHFMKGNQKKRDPNFDFIFESK